MVGPGGAVSGVGELLDDLTAEQRELQECLHSIDGDGWLRPTPARGWDVRDTISHLADTDEMVIATATGEPGSINDRASGAASGEDVTYQGVLRGRRLAGPDVLAWWETTSHSERMMFEALDPNVRVPWGIGMRAQALVGARPRRARGGRRRADGHGPARARRVARDACAPLRLHGCRSRTAGRAGADRIDAAFGCIVEHGAGRGGEPHHGYGK
jgi:uncharacterized protein (TIGR03083 family)